MIVEEKIEGIKQMIVKTVSPEKIILFGSYASGEPSEESDIDLVVIWDSSINYHERNMKIRRLFPHRDFSLDVFVFTPEEETKYKNIKGTILYTAVTKGRILYERK